MIAKHIINNGPILLQLISGEFTGTYNWRQGKCAALNRGTSHHNI